MIFDFFFLTSYVPFVANVEEVCESLGVAYQCCSSKDARKPRKQYLMATGREIETKVLRCDAGRRQPIIHTAIPFMLEAPTFNFGGDIAPFSSSISIASVVASLDWPGANVYRTLLSSQPRNEVIITDLNSQLSELVHEFHQSTKKMPIRIIYFRNGVTEDQLRHTFEHEIDAIRMVCPGARITFVVVAQKSHEFLGSEIGEDCNLTKFFCSHVDEKSNTHVGYRVLHDDNYFTPDKILSLCTDLLIRRVRWRFPQLSMAPAACIAHETALMACDYVEKNRLDDGTFFLPRIFI